MLEKKVYEQAISKIENNEISSALELLKSGKSFQNMKLCGILYCILGEFNNAFKIFKKLSKLKEDLDIKNYLIFLKDKINQDYIPMFNKLIFEIKKNSNSSVDELFFKLENISKNSELYSIATLYYLNNNILDKFSFYYEKLKKLDSSNSLLEKLNFYLKEQNNRKKIKFLYCFLILISTGFLSIGYIKNNEFSKIKIENNQNIISLKNELVAKEQNNLKLKNILAEKDKISMTPEIIVEQVSDPINKYLSNKELYNIGLNKVKSSHYKEAIEIFNFVDLNKLPSYKKKELLFQRGLAYEKLNNNQKALEDFTEYLKNSSEKEYNFYLKIVKNKIRYLTREF